MPGPLPIPLSLFYCIIEGKTRDPYRMKERPFLFNLSRNVFFAGLVSLFMDISSEMVYPLVPLFLTNVLGATRTTVGIIEGIAEATASILKVFSGWLSDRLGRRKLLMGIGYGVSAVSRPVIANAGVWVEVLTARFVDRFGKGIRTAPRDAIIADSTERKRYGAAYGFHRTMDTIGAAIGPGVAFLLLAVFTGNLRLVFLASTLPAVIAVIILVVFIKEKARPVERSRGLPGLGDFAFDHAFRRYIVVIGIFSLGAFSDAFIILRAQDLGVSPELIPVIYLLLNVVYAATAAPMGVLADRVGLRTMLLAGFISYSIVYAGVAFADSALHIWILFPLYGVYKGVSDGTQRAYIAKIAPEERKATAFGVFHTVNGIMLLPASIIAGVLWDRVGPEATFLYGAALSLLAAVYFAFTRK